MPVQTKQGKQWDIQGGKPVLVTPAVAKKSEQMSVARLDREIARAERRKAQAQAQLDRAQSEFDEISTYETELKTLRATVPE